MSKTPPGTDRVELTEADKDALCEWSDRFAREVVADDAWPQLVAAVESIVAARVQALTAERDDLRARLNAANARYRLDFAERNLNRRERDRAYAERDAARAELAAANARCAELESEVRVWRAYKVKSRDRRRELRDERDALQATLDRVTAVISTPDGHREWHNQGRSGVCQVVDVSRLRAALTPEGKP